jgi:hypothetical protein
MPSIMRGRDSEFDTPTWLSLHAPPIHKPEYPDSQEIEEYIARSMIQIPRLVRLLRCFIESPEDLESSAALLSLATELYQNDLEKWVERVQKMGLLYSVPTTIPEYKGLVEDSFYLNSTRLFSRLLKYWLVRCMVSGCVLGILSCASNSAMAPTTGVFQEEEVVKHEEHAANCIIMSVQWGLSSKSRLPIFPTPLAGPLMKAFAVLHRTERRASSQKEAQPAKLLQCSVLQSINVLASNLNAPSLSFTDLIARNNIMQGASFPLRSSY